MLRPLLLASAASAALLLAISPATAQESTESVTVTAEKLAAARNGIQTQTGASTYTITANDIQNQPGGDNLQMNSVILQAPGVVEENNNQAAHNSYIGFSKYWSVSGTRANGQGGISNHPP